MKIKALNRKRIVPKDNFPNLDANALEKVQNAFSKHGPRTVIEGFNVKMQKHDIYTLKDGQWLNDEILNFYANLIMQRSNAHPDEYPCIHMFNTFFYSTLQRSGYAGVKTWTKKVHLHAFRCSFTQINLFEKEMIIIPVHLDVHWCCAVINMLDRRIEYYDSLHGNNAQVFRLLREYLEQESLDKRKEEMDLSDWVDFCPKDIPSQANGYVCPENKLTQLDLIVVCLQVSLPIMLQGMRRLISVKNTCRTFASEWLLKF